MTLVLNRHIVDETSLRTVGLDGLQSSPQARDLEVWCWERAEATGDARFCGFARTFENISGIWDDYGALPTDVLNEVNSAFARHVPAALDVVSAEEGAGLARLLREEVADIFQRWGGRF